MSTGVLMAERRPSEPRQWASVGAEHRALRELKGLTQAELSELAGPGVSEGQISVVEQGKQRPTRDYIEKVAPHLGVRIATLLASAGYPLPEGMDLLPQPTEAAVQDLMIADGGYEPDDIVAFVRIMRAARRPPARGDTPTG